MGRADPELLWEKLPAERWAEGTSGSRCWCVLGGTAGAEGALGSSGATERLGQGADPRKGQWEGVRGRVSAGSRVGSGSEVEALQGICGLWFQVLGAGVV